MINIYGPQETSAKSSLWNRIAEFMHQHNGKFILFGDMNTVRHENERYGSLFSRNEADLLNSFIDSSGLIDLPIGGRYYTRMNKVGTKLSKLDRLLISEGISKDIPDIRVTAIDRMWLDHSPILLHAMKRITVQVALSDIKDIEKKIDDGSASSSNHDKRIKLLQDIDKLDKLVALDLIQKSHIKWDIEGDSMPQDHMPKVLDSTGLSKVIDKVVSKEQSAFIYGRQILDDPLIISEVIQCWRKYLTMSPYRLAFGVLNGAAWIRACLYLLEASILIKGLIIKGKESKNEQKPTRNGKVKTKSESGSQLLKPDQAK
ncbi:RNA-directed DNA polymerase, eukaryota, reverse transcriptase zinc-binding domain protein [Tanacetum coccineum]|uniref:RNA-directed DNA polymerase, eukaryota, reverse transcriptase zinc-binding domain protein n=1 Tax=Tanacetum coccineum TaxID=301880 RepID=A0ABQ4ZEV2_9ASTR